MRLLFTARRLADEGVVFLFGARDGEATYFEGRGVPELRLGGLGSRTRYDSCGRRLGCRSLADCCPACRRNRR